MGAMATKLRLATFNCENLFSRPAILNFDNKQAATPLGDLARLDQLIGQAAYSADDKKEMLALLAALEGYVDVNELRGKLLSQSAKAVKAGGRADWVGGIRLLRCDLPTEAQKNTARVIEAVNADVQVLIEVEDRLVLEQFNRHWLSAERAFPFNMLIDGNDQRGIDVGFFSRLPILRLRSHVFDPDARGKRLFSRDCLEVTFELSDGQPITFLINHFKSKGYGSQAANDARRRAQADRVAAILAGYDLERDRVVVAGDFNDTPDSAALHGLLATPGLTDVLAWKFPNATDRWTYHYRTAKSQIDYLLVSAPLAARVTDAGIERRGLYPLGKLTHGAEAPFPTVTSDTDDASDHAAVWADVGL